MGIPIRWVSLSNPFAQGCAGICLRHLPVTERHSVQASSGNGNAGSSVRDLFTTLTEIPASPGCH